MKATPLETLLAECRAATTSGEIGHGIERIVDMIGATHAARSKLDGQLQEAMVAGRDSGKVLIEIAQVDKDLMQLQAAREGFSEKRRVVLQNEDANEAKALLDKQQLLSRDLEATAKELASTLEKARALGASAAGLIRQHDQNRGALESMNQPPGSRAASIYRSGIGDVRRGGWHGKGENTFGHRLDITLAEALEMNPATLSRARDSRRQGGRFGETYAAQDHAVEAIMGQVRSTRAAG